jgi:hypothetical protein
MVLIAIGTILIGELSPAKHQRHRDCDRSVDRHLKAHSWHMVMSNPSATSAWCQENPDRRRRRDTGMPQPSSSLRYSKRGADREARQLVEEEALAVRGRWRRSPWRRAASREPAMHVSACGATTTLRTS